MEPIKTWRERLPAGVYFYPTSTQMKTAMEAEIADLRAALAASRVPAAQDERSNFEAEMQRVNYNMTMAAGKSGEYAFPPMKAAWHAWQARAALTQKKGE